MLIRRTIKPKRSQILILKISSLLDKIKNLFIFSFLALFLNLPFFSLAYADYAVPYIPPSAAAAAAGALGAMGAAAVSAAGGLAAGVTASGLGGAAAASAAAVGAFAIPFCTTSYLIGTNSCGGPICAALQAAGISCPSDPPAPGSSSGLNRTLPSQAFCNQYAYGYPSSWANPRDCIPKSYAPYAAPAGTFWSCGVPVASPNQTPSCNLMPGVSDGGSAPASPTDVGAAVGASPAAANALGAAARAYAGAASAAPPCAGTMGDFNGVPTCGAAAGDAASPSQSAADARAAAAATAAATNAAQFAAAAAAAAPSQPTTRSCAAGYRLESNGLCTAVPADTCANAQVYSGGQCVPANPLDPTRPLEPTAPADPNAPPAPSTPTVPAFCTWAVAVCDAITWIKADPVASSADTKVTVKQRTTTDVNLTPEQFDTDRFSAPAQCPVDATTSITFMGTSSPINLTYQPICDFLTFVKPAVIAFCSIGACYIIAGANRD